FSIAVTDGEEQWFCPCFVPSVYCLLQVYFCLFQMPKPLTRAFRAVPKTNAANVEWGSTTAAQK
ncbi:MAG: hypothetical protein ACYCQM_13770, partial [Acidithiobacillus sp.]